MSQTLDALSLPLWGSRLIEASAGTGKTWTITALYLRLVLGHGGQNGNSGFGRPLLPSEILVMTFTRAATRELSDRIRGRLLEAAKCFRGELAPGPHDALLANLLADYPEGPARAGAAWRLGLAAESMDDAAVFTIDAWCQRMLREHAFDSGCLFDEELTANEQALLEEAARDYWRQQLYLLSGAAWDAAIGVWRNVEALTDDARQLITQALPDTTGLEGGAGQGSLGPTIGLALARRAAALVDLKQGWAQHAQAMRAWLDQALADKACPFDKRKLQHRFYSVWLGDLAAWANNPQADQLDLKTGNTRLTPTGMNEALKPGLWMALPAVFEAFAQLMAAQAQLPTVAASLRLHAAVCIAQRLAQLKQQSGLFGFADMLSRLDKALDNGGIAASADTPSATTATPTATPTADRLRARMLAQYPVALIDEFQDTSPVQSRIFDRLYRIASNDRNTGLLLIGDPKQSIYGFRGADIYSYLQARLATEGRHYVLGTNHRSTQGLVAAVNHVFEQAEHRAGAGALMFREVAVEGQADDGPPQNAAPHTTPLNPLPFEAVDAKGRPERLVYAGGAMPAMSLNLDARLLDGQTSGRQFAARCAEQIVTLLNDGQAGFEHPTQGFTRLRPADIAVLVRTGREAAAVRRELRRRQVASVYLSDKDSVFDSQEARDVLRWLKAVAAPLDVRLARAALATRTVGLTIAELARLASDDEAFDARSEQLRQLHGIWASQGVLTMLRQTLHLLDLPARWLGAAEAGNGEHVGTHPGPAPDGERRLTNFLHLAELLQTASAQLDGEQALIRWLASQMGNRSSQGDEQIVRLESDADLVKVVTVHKSKGLEYPLVFLPFACSFRAVTKSRARFVSLADGAGQRHLFLQPSDAQIAAADRERQREDLRLLYVALTRARHALWVGLAALKVGNSTDCTANRSAVGYLLCGAAPVSQDDLMATIEAAVSPCADIVLLPTDNAARLACTPLQSRGAPSPLRALLPYVASFDRRWAIGSFTALVRTLAPANLLSWSVAAVRDDEVIDAPFCAPFSAAPAVLVDRSTWQLSVPGQSAPPGEATPDLSQPWHQFPRGAMPGNFLHDQLEWLASEGFELDDPKLQQQLLRRCERQGWGARAPAVLAWMQQLLKTPLPPVGAALGQLGGVLPEMEFWFPSDGLVSAEVDALCRTHLLNGAERPALPERELHGMLMGFADLVFEHGGRYWVLDYKSNHLGDHDAAYTTEALQTAMATHRYDVQAALYLLALHRLLRARLGVAYVPTQHLGGAAYLFLRGIQGPAHGCYHVPPPMALLDALDALLGQPNQACP